MGENRRIPLYVPALGGEELENLTACLEANELIRGPFATRFESDIAGFVGRAHGVGTNSGTAALHIALLLAGIRADDEVLITTLTFIAPANAITYVGAHPVFIDVDAESWQMSPAEIERFIDRNCRFDGEQLVNVETGRRVSGIVVVHFLGAPAEIDRIAQLAARYNLAVIEDAAQALGTEYRGRRAGGIAPIGCFSFYGNKLITAGGGGMIVTDDDAAAARARYLVNQAKDDPVETVHHAIGYNYRMTNLHGAIGCAQFARIDAHIAAKRAIAARYAEELADLPGIDMMQERSDASYTYWLTSIRVDAEAFGMTARQLLALLAEQEIEALPLYQPLHLSKAHAGAQHSGGAVAERLCDEVLSLPSSVDLSPSDQARVIGAIASAARPRSAAAA